MNRYDPLRTWLVLFAATALLSAACIRYIDRPISDYVATHSSTTAIRAVVDPVFMAMGAVALLTMLSLLGCGLWLATGRQVTPHARIPLLCAATLLWGFGAEMVLKQVFGRLNPDYYLSHGYYSFRWLHGALSEDVFPSGTAIAVSGLTAVLWSATPRLRAPAVIASVVLCSATVVANRHWLGDIVAGAFVGGTIGWIAERAYAAATREAGQDSSAD
jgi:membrane-associated phospholipid phosphatase